MDGGITIRYNEETGLWEKHEPFITIDVMTEEDYNMIKTAVEHYMKRGKWLYVSGDGRHAEYECSECHGHVCFDEKADGSIPVYRGCPHCLVRMDAPETKE